MNKNHIQQVTKLDLNQLNRSNINQILFSLHRSSRISFQQKDEFIKEQ
jgi:hypothetical protein